MVREAIEGHKNIRKENIDVPKAEKPKPKPKPSREKNLAKKQSKMPKIDQRGTLGFPSLKKGKSGGGVVTNNAADAILDQDPYGIDVAIANWANFAFSCSDTGRWEKALSAIPFFVHITTHASDLFQFVVAM